MVCVGRVACAQRGFTLVEVMVALVTLCGVLLLLAQVLLQGGQRRLLAERRQGQRRLGQHTAADAFDLRAFGILLKVALAGLLIEPPGQILRQQSFRKRSPQQQHHFAAGQPGPPRWFVRQRLPPSWRIQTEFLCVLTYSYLVAFKI